MEEVAKLGEMSIAEHPETGFQSSPKPEPIARNGCLKLFLEGVQGISSEALINLVETAWSEDPALTLKLIFHLRDARKGKGAILEFHYCLLWLHNHHPKTLIANVPFIPQHGYWKDLCSLIKFIAAGCVDTSRSQPAIERQEKDFLFLTPQEGLEKKESIEDFVTKLLEGKLPKDSWHKFLGDFKTAEAQAEAKQKYHSIVKKVHREQRHRSKETKKLAIAQVAKQLEAKKKDSANFARLYDAVVQSFVTTLKQDKETLDRTGQLPPTSLAGKWAPTIDCSIDNSTLLGKSIALALFPEDQYRRPTEPLKMYRQRCFTLYRKEYLVKLRAAINVVESIMSRGRWDSVDYERVPSVCMKRNKRIFAKHDLGRFNAYLHDVKKGKNKVAAGTVPSDEPKAQVEKTYLKLAPAHDSDFFEKEIREGTGTVAGGSAGYTDEHSSISRRFEAGDPLQKTTSESNGGNRNLHPNVCDEMGNAIASGFFKKLKKRLLLDGKFGSLYDVMIESLNDSYDSLTVVD